MADTLNLLSLNVGNPSLERAKMQCKWLEKRAEDVFVLTETKNSKGCSFIEEFFLQYGYDLFSINSEINYSVSFPKSQTGDLGVMIISKYPIYKKINFFPEESIYYARETEAIISVNNIEINIVGLYVPSRDRSTEKIERKQKFIGNIENYIATSQNTKKIIMGDFNILDRNHIPHYSTFYDWEYLFYDKIKNAGYIDTYKYCNGDNQDYSWVGRTNDGYRYDYCFVSSDFRDSILSCRYIHETREMSLTDHSAITTELQIGPADREKIV